MMKPRFTTVLIVASVAAACASASAQQVVLRVGSQFSVAEWFLKIAQQFEKETGIRVEHSYLEWGGVGMEKFLTETAGGLSYDVVEMESRWLSAVQGKGLVRPLDTYIRRDAFDIKDFFAPSIAAVSSGQNTWAIPHNNIDQYIPFINLDMWDAAGLAYPSHDWTWDEYGAVMKKLTRIDPAGTNSVFGGNGLLWQTVAYSFGADVITADGRFDMNKAAVVNGLQWSYDLRLIDHVFPRNSAEVGGVANHARFPAGKVASHWAGSWYATSSHMHGATIRWGIAMPPASPYGRATTAFVGGWFIPTTSKNPDVAWQFIKFMYRNDFLENHFRTFSAALPSKRSIAAKQNIMVWNTFGKWSQVILDTANIARATPFHPLTDRIWAEIGTELAAAESGTQSVKAAIDKLVPRVNAILAEGAAR